MRVLKARRSNLAPLKAFNEKSLTKGSSTASINSQVSKKNKGEPDE